MTETICEREEGEKHWENNEQMKSYICKTDFGRVISRKSAPNIQQMHSMSHRSSQFEQLSGGRNCRTECGRIPTATSDMESEKHCELGRWGRTKRYSDQFQSHFARRLQQFGGHFQIATEFGRQRTLRSRIGDPNAKEQAGGGRRKGEIGRNEKEERDRKRM